MARRVRVTPEEAKEAAERIGRRREQCDDPDRTRMRHGYDSVCCYVHLYQRVPAQVIAADVADALLICDYRQAIIDDDRLRLIRAARHAGMTYRELAPRLVAADSRNPRQAVEALVRRLEAAVEVDNEQAANQHTRHPKDEAHSRAKRREERHAVERQAAEAREQHDALHAIVRTLVTHRAEMPDLQEELDELARKFAVGASVAGQLQLINSWLVDTPTSTAVRGALDDAAALLGWRSGATSGRFYDPDTDWSALAPGSGDSGA